MKVTPATGQSGSTQITVSVSDGLNTTSDSFTLAVQALVNNPPSISTIGNQVANENQTTAAISFTSLGTPEASHSASSLTGGPGDFVQYGPRVPNANIALGGSGTRIAR